MSIEGYCILPTIMHKELFSFVQLSQQLCKWKVGSNPKGIEIMHEITSIDIYIHSEAKFAFVVFHWNVHLVILGRWWCVFHVHPWWSALLARLPDMQNQQIVARISRSDLQSLQQASLCMYFNYFTEWYWFSFLDILDGSWISQLFCQHLVREAVSWVSWWQTD